MKKSIICGMISVMVIVLVSGLAMYQVNSKSSSLLLSNIEALTNVEISEGFEYVNCTEVRAEDEKTHSIIVSYTLVCTGKGEVECKCIL